jgi:RNA polymerase sigma-70 factor (ECF subfamily)
MMCVMESKKDNELFLELKSGSGSAFESLFHKYYASLCLFSFHFLHDREAAEEAVQEVFMKIWLKRKQLNIGASVKNYLFYSVRNQCLNRMQHERVEKRYALQVQAEVPDEQDPDRYFMEVGLFKKIEEGIAMLPEKRREIFRLSREEGLKYQEIAFRLNISLKTVEAQMGLALKQLRKELKDYSDLL